MIYRGTHATTLYRIGDRVFSLANVQSIDLAYPPARHNVHKPPSTEMGVQIILLSGHQLQPLWDREAAVFRDFLTGGEVDVRRLERPGLTVLTLVPEPEPVETTEPRRWPGLPSDPDSDLRRELAKLRAKDAPTWNGEPMTGLQFREKIAEMRAEAIESAFHHKS